MLTQGEYELGMGTTEERSWFLQHFLRQQVIDYNPRIMKKVETPIAKGLKREIIWVGVASVLCLGTLGVLVWAGVTYL